MGVTPKAVLAGPPSLTTPPAPRVSGAITDPLTGDSGLLRLAAARPDVPYAALQGFPCDRLRAPYTACLWHEAHEGPPRRDAQAPGPADSTAIPLCTQSPTHTQAATPWPKSRFTPCASWSSEPPPPRLPAPRTETLRSDTLACSLQLCLWCIPSTSASPAWDAGDDQPREGHGHTSRCCWTAQLHRSPKQHFTIDLSRSGRQGAGRTGHWGHYPLSALIRLPEVAAVLPSLQPRPTPVIRVPGTLPPPASKVPPFPRPPLRWPAQAHVSLVPCSRVAPVALHDRLTQPRD